MAHQADSTFFDQKKPWSQYKDLILRYYLRPYLQKVKNLGRPILLIDGYAGPGRFKDGSEGSPFFISRAIAPLAESGVSVSALFVERDESKFNELKKNMMPFESFVELRNADFGDCVTEIAKLADSNTVFLYMDPFSLSRVHLGHLAEIFSKIQSGSSVELLLVLMAHTFVRWAHACQQAELDGSEVLFDKYVMGEEDRFDEEMANAIWDMKSVRSAKSAITSRAELDGIAGGQYWRAIIDDTSLIHSERAQAFVDSYVEKLRQWFSVVCSYPLKADPSSQDAKYWVVFGSRYRPSIDLINGAITSARRKQHEDSKAGTLFGESELEPELTHHQLERAVLKQLETGPPLRWRELRWRLSLAIIGQAKESEINKAIKSLCKAGTISGSDGQKNDQTALLFVTPP